MAMSIGSHSALAKLAEKFEYNFKDDKTNKTYKLDFDFDAVSALVSNVRHSILISFAVAVMVFNFVAGVITNTDLFTQNSDHFDPLVMVVLIVSLIACFAIAPSINVLLSTKTVKKTFFEYPKGMSRDEAHRIVMSAHDEICEANDIVVFC